MPHGRLIEALAALNGVHATEGELGSCPAASKARLTSAQITTIRATAARSRRQRAATRASAEGPLCATPALSSVNGRQLLDPFDGFLQRRH